MGRWGHRLFEGDQDLDIAIEISDSFKEEDLHLSQLVHQTDMLAPSESRMLYQTEEYAAVLAQDVVELRQKLDAGGLGDKLVDFYRAKESEGSGLGQTDGKYRLILVGALIMRTGAKIRDSDLQHLREMVPQINSNPSFVLPLGDHGFRDPGKAQFIAALDHYTPGTPRNYSEPSCFTCGQVEADINKVPLRCGQCRGAWYCDTTCQRAHWKAHKTTCGKRSSSNVTSLNV